MDFAVYWKNQPAFACCEPRRILTNWTDPDCKPLSIIDDFDRWFRITRMSVEFERDYYKRNPRGHAAESEG